MIVIDYDFTTISFTNDYYQLRPDKLSETGVKKEEILQINGVNKRLKKKKTNYFVPFFSLLLRSLDIYLIQVYSRIYINNILFSY